MLGRRMYHRHVVSNSTGTLHVLSEVTVQHYEKNQLIATADEAHLPGELLAIEVVGSPAASRTHVRVLESCPILVDGSIRHRLRLVPVDDAEA